MPDVGCRRYVYCVFCLRRGIYTALLVALAAMLYLAAGWPRQSGQMTVTSPEQRNGTESRLSAPSVADAEASVSQYFSPEMEDLIDAIHRGERLTFRANGLADQEILLRPQRVLAEQFRVSLGGDDKGKSGGGFIDSGIRVFEGRSFSTIGNVPPARVTLVVVGAFLNMTIEAADGSQLHVSGNDPGDVEVALTVGSEEKDSVCRIEGNVRAVMTSPMVAGGFEHSPDVESLVQNLTRGEITSEPAVLGLAGADPATGKLDRFVEPIPMAEQYALSLKDIQLLLVLDKSATGDDSPENLEMKASQAIARIANVATIYEHQLGLRLLLQELVLIPDTADYSDIPYRDPLKGFRDWCHTNRRFSVYDWTCAMKEGAGLRGDDALGIANIGRVFQREAVSVVKPNAGYLVYAHELAHNLGTLHTNGGIMNAEVLANHRRNFFTDVIGKDGETAAKDIYSYLQARLGGAAARLRHPEEMPFANSDVVETGIGEPVAIRVMSNDADHARHGKVNSVLSIIETSRVLPEGAGVATVRSDGQGVTFQPSVDFAGTAWFSYTLRGNVGNDSQGWLHKGDVAVVVKDEANEESSREVHVRPGASYSFYPAVRSADFTQPMQSQLIRSADDRSLLILRVPAEAAGSDSFMVGKETYTIIYTDDPPLAVTDTVWIDRYRSSIWIQPLVNDLGAGQLWLQQIDPFIGAGTPGRAAFSSHFFATSMRLESAENLDPELGEFKLEQLPVTIAGDSRYVNTGRIEYSPNKGVEGVGTIVYTLVDASDRRVEGVIQVHVNGGYDALIENDQLAAIAVPDKNNAEELVEWRLLNFDDSSWQTGPMAVGYELNEGYEEWIGTNLEDSLFRKGTGVYARVPFVVSETAAYTELGFRARFDDGFVAYLNGQRVASKNAPSDERLTWESVATESDEHEPDEPFHVVDLSVYRDLLQPGKNVLSLHVMNDASSSSDLLMQPALVAYPAAPEAPAISPFLERFLEWRGTFEGSDGTLDPDWRTWDSDFDSYTDRVEFAAVRSPVDPGGRPFLTVNAVQSGVRLTVSLRYLQRTDADELGILYVIEQATALLRNDRAVWNSIDLDALVASGGSVTTSPYADGVESVDVRIPFDSRDVTDTFYRMRYVLPE